MEKTLASQGSSSINGWRASPTVRGFAVQALDAQIRELQQLKKSMHHRENVPELWSRFDKWKGATTARLRDALDEEVARNLQTTPSEKRTLEGLQVTIDRHAHHLHALRGALGKSKFESAKLVELLQSALSLLLTLGIGFVRGVFQQFTIFFLILITTLASAIVASFFFG